MPEKVYEFLRRGIESFRPNPRFQNLEEKNKAEALAVFERWRLAPWPDLTGLRRVHVDFAEKSTDARPDRINAWRISGKLLLVDNFQVRPVVREKITPFEYEDELREMVAYAEARVKVKTVAEGEALRKRPLRFVRGMCLKDSPLFPACVPFHHAYAAALLGHEEAVDPLVRAAMHPHGELKLHVYDRLAEDRINYAMRLFRGGSSRSELLEALEETHTLYPGSGRDWEVVSLIKPLRRELAEGPPDYVRKRPEERSEEEEIRALIYECRDIAGHQLSVPGYPDVFGNWSFVPRVSPARRLVRSGQKTIPYLIEALDDYAPTRTVGHRWSARLLRRMDVAMHVIEMIAGCDFYEEASTSGDLHNDTPERRSAAVENVKKWWVMSRDTSQAQMIRNQLSLWGTNASLRIYERRKAIHNLALIYGPDRALAEIARLPDDAPEDRRGADRKSSRQIATEQSDPRRTILAKFDRFWNNSSKYGDYSDIARYGDRRVYAELARLFEASGVIDPTSPDRYRQYQLPRAARHGKNWAIPILAHALTLTDMKHEYRKGGKAGRYSDADVIADEFQELTGRDFGYRKGDDDEKRLTAIRKAREWWLAEGRTALAEKIAEDRPPGEGSGDLFMSDEEIATCVAAISGGDAALRRKTVAELGQTFDYRVQRALMEALARETDAETRAAIIRILTPHARPWHLPPVVRRMEEDASVPVRVEAAKLVAKVGPLGNWWNLEPCTVAVKAARSVAKDRDAPVEVRRAAAEVLMGGSSWGAGWLGELSLLSGLAANPAFADFDKLQRYVGEKEEMLRRALKAKDQKNQ